MGHRAVAERPGEAGLGVEPEDAAGAGAHVGERPRLGRLVVVPPVADDDDGGPGRDRVEVALPEVAEGAPEVAEPVALAATSSGRLRFLMKRRAWPRTIRESVRGG